MLTKVSEKEYKAILGEEILKGRAGSHSLTFYICLSLCGKRLQDLCSRWLLLHHGPQPGEQHYCC